MFRFVVDSADEFGFDFGGEQVAGFSDLVLARQCCEEVARVSGGAARVRDTWFSSDGGEVVFEAPVVDKRRLVALCDGRQVAAEVKLVGGAALAGSPTAYCVVDGRRVWVKPGESVEFVEVPEWSEVREFARAVEAWDA